MRNASLAVFLLCSAFTSGAIADPVHIMGEVCDFHAEIFCEGGESYDFVFEDLRSHATKRLNAEFVRLQRAPTPLCTPLAADIADIHLEELECMHREVDYWQKNDRGQGSRFFEAMYHLYKELPTCHGTQCPMNFEKSVNKLRDAVDMARSDLAMQERALQMPASEPLPHSTSEVPAESQKTLPEDMSIEELLALPVGEPPDRKPEVIDPTPAAVSKQKDTHLTKEIPEKKILPEEAVSHDQLPESAIKKGPFVIVDPKLGEQAAYLATQFCQVRRYDDLREPRSRLTTSLRTLISSLIFVQELTYRSTVSECLLSIEEVAER